MGMGARLAKKGGEKKKCYVPYACIYIYMYVYTIERLQGCRIQWNFRTFFSPCTTTIIVICTTHKILTYTFNHHTFLPFFFAGIKKCKSTSGGEQVGIKTLTNLKPNSFSALELQSSVIHCAKGILSAYT